MFLVAAASAGLGGGNFASSMANISFFYPDRRKGYALGLNAAGGNAGVSSVQLLVPAIVGLAIFGSASGLHLENIAFLWVLLALVAAAGAWFFMDNLSEARSSFRDQACGSPAGADLGDGAAVCRHVRLVHRVQLRVAPIDEDPVP